MPQIKVVKRNTSIEEFQPEKIGRVVNAAGLTADESSALAAKIASWAESLKRDTLTSLEIRDRVLQELRSVNTYAANLFEWYQKTKEN